MSPRDLLPAVITTERLTLRAPNLADVPELVALLNVWEVVEPTAVIPFPYTEDDGREFVNTLGAADKAHSYAIAAMDDSLLGVVGMKFTEGGPPEIGYWVGKPYWGQGYASEAVLGLLGAAQAIGVNYVRARALAHNEKSLRVLEKCGFEKVERTTSVVERHRGKPILIMSRSAP
jgi:RimJ/RimL family protein N-acetyltransferase